MNRTFMEFINFYDDRACKSKRKTEFRIIMFSTSNVCNLSVERVGVIIKSEIEL